MNTLYPLAVVSLCSSFAFSVAGGQTLHRFKKIQLSDTFYGEGANFADLNNDGVLDIASGPFWYAGPEFEEKREIYPAKPFDPRHYSDSFFMFPHDFNGDGWSDLLMVGFPGEAAFWFENPKGEEGHWKRHDVFPEVGNESPFFADITGDGKPELVFNTSAHLGYAEWDPENPESPWKFVAVSPKGDWHRFTHGLGYGDINGDGRLDLVTRQGWWEQPESLEGAPEWKLHPVDFGQGGAQMYVYDFDGDGRNDVVSANQAHGWGLAWFRQGKDGQFAREPIMGERHRDSRYGVRFSQPHAMDLVDVDGDGVKDLVTGKRAWAHGADGDPESNAPGVVFWFRTVRGENGAVDFVPHRADNESGVGTQVVAGDVSGNGFPDIVIGNKNGTFLLLHEPEEVTSREWESAQPRPVLFHRLK